MAVEEHAYYTMTQATGTRIICSHRTHCAPWRWKIELKVFAACAKHAYYDMSEAVGHVSEFPRKVLCLEMSAIFGGERWN